MVLVALLGCIVAFLIYRRAMRKLTRYFRPGDGDIRGKIVLLTGAGGGLGRALALELSRRGCRLALVDVAAAANEETASLVRADAASAAREDVARAYTADLRRRDHIQLLVDEVVADFGRVDILVSNAAILECGSLEGYADDSVDAVFEVNLMATVRLTRALLPRMRLWGGGHVVAVSSLAAHVGVRDMTLYCSTKAGLTHFMEALYHELREKKDKIHVTTIHPYFINTHTQLAGAIAINKNLSGTMLDTSRAARRIASAVAHREVMVFLPWWMAVVSGMSCLWPRWLNNLAHLPSSSVKVTRVPFAFRHRQRSPSLLQDCLAGGFDLVEDPADVIQTLMDSESPLPFDFLPHVGKLRSFYELRELSMPEVVDKFIVRMQRSARPKPEVPERPERAAA